MLTTRLSLALGAVLIMLLPAARDAAAQDTGTLSATVVDASGLAVPGATITLTNESTGAVRTMVSNERGDFTFRAVQPGTYSVAVLARAHGIPFYVAAPSSTVDLSMASGDQIPIEQRDTREVTYVRGETHIAPQGVSVLNPAFDVTPARLITGIITEKGVFAPGELAAHMT